MVCCSLSQLCSSGHTTGPALCPTVQWIGDRQGKQRCLHLVRQSESHLLSGQVTPDMAHLISPYWNQFPAMDPIWAKILTAYMIMIGMISWCGNGVVIYIFATTKSLRTPANLLVINLAISDFGIMITNTPMMGINLYFETWVLGPMMCDIYAGLGSAFGCSSIWSMCMISLDRYQVIVKGMAGRPMTIPLALGKIAYIWFMSSIWCLAPAFGWSR